MAEELVSALVNLREKEALEIVKERLRTGSDPLKLVEDGRIAMEIVGKRFEEGIISCQSLYIPVRYCGR